MPDPKAFTRTLAGRVFARLPQVRARLEASDGFRTWLETHPSVVVDEQTFFVVGGDMLRDHEEMLLDWARGQGAIPADVLSAAQSDE